MDMKGYCLRLNKALSGHIDLVWQKPDIALQPLLLREFHLAAEMIQMSPHASGVGEGDKKTLLLHHPTSDTHTIPDPIPFLCRFPYIFVISPRSDLKNAKAAKAAMATARRGFPIPRLVSRFCIWRSMQFVPSIAQRLEEPEEWSPETLKAENHGRDHVPWNDRSVTHVASNLRSTWSSNLNAKMLHARKSCQALPSTIHSLLNHYRIAVTQTQPWTLFRSL